jgi:hypothetical protein
VLCNLSAKCTDCIVYSDIVTCKLISESAVHPFSSRFACQERTVFMLWRQFEWSKYILKYLDTSPRDQPFALNSNIHPSRAAETFALLADL